MGKPFIFDIATLLFGLHNEQIQFIVGLRHYIYIYIFFFNSRGSSNRHKCLFELHILAFLRIMLLRKFSLLPKVLVRVMKKTPSLLQRVLLKGAENERRGSLPFIEW